VVEDAHCAVCAAPLEQLKLSRVIRKLKSAAVHAAGQAHLHRDCLACAAAGRGDRECAALGLCEGRAEGEQERQDEEQWEKSFFHGATLVS